MTNKTIYFALLNPRFCPFVVGPMADNRRIILLHFYMYLQVLTSHHKFILYVRFFRYENIFQQSLCMISNFTVSARLGMYMCVQINQLTPAASATTTGKKYNNNNHNNDGKIEQRNKNKIFKAFIANDMVNIYIQFYTTVLVFHHLCHSIFFL